MFGWITRILACFVFGGLMLTMPFTKLGNDEPWYFWVGSSLLAFLAGFLLIWITPRSPKNEDRLEDEGEIE
jgi:hypothetical protein